jgi:transcriptional regulator of NAD metabolism
MSMTALSTKEYEKLVNERNELNKIILDLNKNYNLSRETNKQHKETIETPKQEIMELKQEIIGLKQINAIAMKKNR